MKDIFKPYLQQESAVAWINRHLPEEGISLRMVYHLEIISKLVQDGYGEEIYRRLPAEAGRGLQEGGRENIIPGVLLRGNAGAGGKDPLAYDAAEIEQETLLRSWAVRDGCWWENADEVVSAAYEFLDEGGEARCYRLDSKFVLKVIDSPGLGGIQMLMDRVSLHNYLFPETQMKVVGFGHGKNGCFSVIVNQPYIHGEKTSPADTARMVTDAGFHLIDGVRIPYTFFTDKFCLGDLHERNVLTDDDGEINVIDCDVRLNTPDLGYGGTYEIPPVSFSEGALEKFSVILDSLVPKRLLRDRFETAFFHQDESLPEQLELTGRYDGCLVAHNRAGDEMMISVQVDPDDSRYVLYTDRSNISVMMDGDDEFPEKEYNEMTFGKGVWKGDAFYAFNLAKGRVDRVVNYEQKLRKALKEKEIGNSRQSGVRYGKHQGNDRKR